MNCVNKYRVAFPKYGDLTSGKNNINVTPRWCYEVYDCTVCKWNVIAVNCGRTNEAEEKRIAELEARCMELFMQNNQFAEQLEYAKTIIQDLLDNSDEYARQRAMDFLEDKK